MYDLSHEPLGQVLNPKSNVAAAAAGTGADHRLSAATYGYIESRRTEQVIIAVRYVPYGQLISADDLGTIELPLHRPASSPVSVTRTIVGTWAARGIGPNDLLQATMLLDTIAPDQPVYPSGQKLERTPYHSVLDRDHRPADPSRFRERRLQRDQWRSRRCVANGGMVSARRATARRNDDRDAAGRPVRLPPAGARQGTVGRHGKNVAYLQMTPYQAHTIWALQPPACRCGASAMAHPPTSCPRWIAWTPPRSAPNRLTMTSTDTLKLYNPQGFGGGIPGRCHEHDPRPADRSRRAADCWRPRTQAAVGRKATRMTVTATTPTTGSPEPAATPTRRARVEELRFLVQTGRLRHWQRGVTETLARAGLGGGLTVDEWAATPWYGPLEAWLRTARPSPTC